VAKRTASAKKQARAGVRRSLRNRGVRSEVKTRVVKARRGFTESPVAEADRAALALDAIRSLDRAASKGILHRNNAARRKARLMRQLVKLGISRPAAPAAPAAAKAGGRGKAAPAKKGAPAPAAADKKGKS
jgi:small subunit ribosomal protein S20